jgi:hypothetical protein
MIVRAAGVWARVCDVWHGQFSGYKRKNSAPERSLGRNAQSRPGRCQATMILEVEQIWLRIQAAFIRQKRLRR